MDRAAIEAKIQEYTQTKQQVVQRVGEIREALERAVIDAHQLDGAIGALKGLLPTENAE